MVYLALSSTERDPATECNESRIGCNFSIKYNAATETNEMMYTQLNYETQVRLITTFDSST